MTERSFSKRDTETLQIILGFCEDVDRLLKLHGSDEADFQGNISLRYSCVFCLIRIGEHIKRLSDGLKDTYPEIDWINAAGMRDFAVHSYMDVIIPVVRSTVLERIPPLRRTCRNILDGLCDP